MPRQRAINPEFWVDDKLAELSLGARLFYIGLWNFADDYGVVEAAIPKLKAQVFPYDEGLDIKLFIEELVSAHRLFPYQAEGKDWFHIRNFLKWQKIEKPSIKRNPPPPFTDYSPTPPLPVGSEVKRSKVKQSKENKQPAVAYSYKDYLQKLLTSDRRDMHLIGLYWQFKNYDIPDTAGATKELRRSLRAAQGLVGYSDEKILATMDYMTGLAYLKKWSFETVSNYINEI